MGTSTTGVQKSIVTSLTYMVNVVLLASRILPPLVSLQLALSLDVLERFKVIHCSVNLKR